MKVLVLGAPKIAPDHWQDDLADDARLLGWQVDYLRIAGRPTADLVAAARGAHMVIWCYTHNHYPSGDPAVMLRLMEDNGARTVGVHLDLYWGLPRESRIGSNPWWSCQYIYTSDGGQRDWASKGINHRWCPAAVGTRHLGLSSPRGQHRYIFVGAYTNSIHTDHRRALIAWAKRTWPRDFNWYGHTPHSRLHGQSLSAAVSFAYCVLGDSAPAPWYWSDRVPRVLARGGVLAHPQVEGMDLLGLDKSNILFYDRYDFEGLAERIASTDREQIREAAIEAVRSRHCWAHRLQQIAGEVLG